MPRTLTAGVDYAHPHSLKTSARSGQEGSPLSGDDFLCVHGRALGLALDRSGITQKQAAFAMGYTDPAVVNRWCLGRERMQLDKLRALGDAFFSELLVALAQTCQGVEVRTQVTLIKRSA